MERLVLLEVDPYLTGDMMIGMHVAPEGKFTAIDIARFTTCSLCAVKCQSLTT